MLKRVTDIFRNMPLPARYCLGVESADDELRGVLVRAVGGRREILDYAAVRSGESRDDLPAIAQLRELAGRLNCPGGVKAVFVAPLVRVAVMPMNRDRVMAMRSHVLGEAVKWEAEAYTGIPAGQALAGLEIETPSAEPGRIRDDDEEEVLVHVSMLEQNLYRAAVERFRLAGMRLLRIYPGESCFHVPLMVDGAEGSRAVLDIGSSSSGFALLEGRQPLAINSLNVTAEMIRNHLDGRIVPDLEDTLGFSLRQAPPNRPVVVTGAGGLDRRIMDYLGTLAPGGVRPLELNRSSGLVAAGGEGGALFATAYGAALRELSRSDYRTIGISDALPLATRIRKSFYVLPLAAALAFFLLLLGHNLLMRYQENSLAGQTAQLTSQITERRQEADQARRLNERQGRAEQEIEQLRRRVAFVTGERKQPHHSAIEFFETLGGRMSERVVLSGIQQERNNASFLIAGRGHSVAAVLEFALGLGESEIVKSVDVRRLEEDRGGNRAMSQRFLVQVQVRP